jgi:hypothetical protein
MDKPELAVTIRSPSSRPPRPGDLAVRLAGDHVTVPHQLAHLVEQIPVRSLSDLIVLLDTYPTDVASELEWVLDDVRLARERLVEELRDHLNPLLVAHQPTRRAFGAREPEQPTGIRRRPG